MAIETGDRATEQPIEDVIEQQTPVDPQDTDGTDGTDETATARLAETVEADPADVVDQRRPAPGPDERARRG